MKLVDLLLETQLPSSIQGANDVRQILAFVGITNPDSIYNDKRSKGRRYKVNYLPSKTDLIINKSLAKKIAKQVGDLLVNKYKCNKEDIYIAQYGSNGMQFEFTVLN